MTTGMPAARGLDARPARREISSACNGRSSPRARPASLHRRASRRPGCRWSRRCWCRRCARRPPAARPSRMLRVPSTLVAIQLPRVGRAEPVVGRDVEQRLAAGERALERGAVGQIARPRSRPADACRLRAVRAARAPARAPASPSRSSARATAAPTNPVAPVTSAFTGYAPGAGACGRAARAGRAARIAESARVASR